MNVFLNIIHCCRSEESIKNQIKCGINVPIENNKNYSHEKQESKYNESSNIKSSEINNTMTINENNNNSNNYISNINEDNSNNQNINNINNNNLININSNINQSPNNINKSDTFVIQNKGISLSPRRNNNYKHLLSNIHMNINNKIANNNSNKSNKNLAKKNMSSGNLSKINVKSVKDLMSNKGTILTLNDLVFINQNQEEDVKMNEIGSKLLLSGELFFWKEIILQTNGIKNSLRKEKDDHVFFGLKNKSNYAGVMYNDIIINLFWHQEDAEIIETNTGRVFEIYYNKISKDYTLRFIHPNLILYYKVNNFVYFNTGKEYYLLLGHVFLTICVKKTSPIEKTIVVQIEIDNNKPIKYTFNQNQTPIRIGRISNSEVPIFSTSISKRHGIIEYSKNSQSFYYKDMGSTNSSILLIKDGDNLKIKGEMNFKLEDVQFKIQEIQ